jgi:hypothetical protein
LSLNPDGRFESFEEMSRCLLAAAAELGVAAEAGLTHLQRPMVKLTIAELDGELVVEEAVNWVGAKPTDFERITPFRETYALSAPTQEVAPQVHAEARKVLRRAQALAE